jgi:hypothetical protein
MESDGKRNEIGFIYARKHTHTQHNDEVDGDISYYVYYNNGMCDSFTTKSEIADLDNPGCLINTRKKKEELSEKFTCIHCVYLVIAILTSIPTIAIVIKNLFMLNIIFGAISSFVFTTWGIAGLVHLYKCKSIENENEICLGKLLKELEAQTLKAQKQKLEATDITIHQDTRGYYSSSLKERCLEAAKRVSGKTTDDFVPLT